MSIKFTKGTRVRLLKDAPEVNLKAGSVGTLMEDAYNVGENPSIWDAIPIVNWDGFKGGYTLGIVKEPSCWAVLSEDLEAA